MLTPPEGIMVVLHHFAPVFSERIWDWVQVLVMGAILAPKKRTVTSALRVMGLGQEKQFQNYHRVLNRAKWSGLKASKIMLGLLVLAFVPPDATIVVAADDTLERRRGAKIKAKGFFRDPVRSTKKKDVVSEGLRWMSMMLLVPVPWNKRVWALPFLTVLAAHKKTNEAQRLRHKTTIDWVGQMIGQVRRWLAQREVVLVVDGALSAVKLGLRCSNYANPVILVSRLRLDARLYDGPLPKANGQRGPQARVGRLQPNLKTRLKDPKTRWQRQRVAWYGGKQRLIEFVTGTALWSTTSEKDPLPLRWVLVRDPLGKFDPQAFLCTDQTVSALQILAWYVLRWNVEVTFEEVRAHLGFESQRQWSDLAIARTSPIILGLFSFVTVAAQHLTQGQNLPIRSSSWYTKQEATFADVLAFVRGYIWQHGKLFQSPFNAGLQKIPRSALNNLVEAIYYAA